MGVVKHVNERYKLMSELVELTIILLWICGIAIAKGFWSTLVAIFFPPWALLLFMAQLLNKFGII
jgi:hypothetical protein